MLAILTLSTNIRHTMYLGKATIAVTILGLSPFFKGFGCLLQFTHALVCAIAFLLLLYIERERVNGLFVSCLEESS